ncbi:MAG: hypothetical protein RIS58_493 [Actinomycetota bacterium]
MNDDYRLLVSIRRAITAITRMAAFASLALAIPIPPAQATAPISSLDVRLVAQNFNVATSRQLRFVLSFADQSVIESLGQDGTVRIRISLGAPFTSANQVTSSLTETETEKHVAEVNLPFRSAQRNSVGDLVVLSSFTGDLRRLVTGVYPVSVNIVRGTSSLGGIKTFVNVFEDGEEFVPLPVSMVVAVDAPNSFTPQGEPGLGSQTRIKLNAATTLAELEPTPLSMHIAPHVLEALVRSTAAEDVALRERLLAALPRHEVLSTTFVPFDASSAARSSLDESFGEQLQFGEVSIDKFNGDSALDRTVWFSPVPVDRDGVSLLRQFGFQSLVLTPQAAAGLGTLDNYAKPYRANGSTNGSTMALRTIDPLHAQLLSAQTGNQLINAYALAAAIIVSRTEIVASGGDPSTRHVVLSSITGSPPAVATAVPLLIALDRAPQLKIAPLSEATVSVGASASVNLRRADRVSLLDRREPLATIAAEIASTTSMLAADAPQHERWTTSRLSCGHDGLDPEQFQLCLRGIRGQLRSLRNQVSIPQSLTFTLGGRESDLRLQLRNAAAQPLSVVVKLESSKLQFPEGPRKVTIPPTSSLDILIAVRARANGRFPVEVVLNTPDELTQVGRRVQMTARVSALAGLGQVVTGAAIIILLTWWVSHLRSKSRAKASQNHPAVH